MDIAAFLALQNRSFVEIAPSGGQSPSFFLADGDLHSWQYLGGQLVSTDPARVSARTQQLVTVPHRASVAFTASIKGFYRAWVIFCVCARGSRAFLFPAKNDDDGGGGGGGATTIITRH